MEDAIMQAKRLSDAVLLVKLGIEPELVVQLSLDQRAELLAILEKVSPEDYFANTKLVDARRLVAVPSKLASEPEPPAVAAPALLTSAAEPLVTERAEPIVVDESHESESAYP